MTTKDKKEESTTSSKKEEEKKKPPPAAIDTTELPGNDDDDDDDDDGLVMSNMLMVCVLFIVHTVTNAFLLSGYNTSRCMFWGLGSCPPDLGWITNWVSLGQIQIALMIGVLIKSVHGNPTQEVKVSYLVGVILCIKITVGMISKPHLHRPFLLVQLMIWMVQLACLGWFTYTEYDEPLQIQNNRSGGGRTPTPRELFVAVARMQGGSNRSLMTVGIAGSSVPGTPSGSMTPRGSFDGRNKFSVVTIALAVMLIGALVQTLELVALEDKSSYYAGASAYIRYVS